jgi:hypothetical protein
MPGRSDLKTLAVLQEQGIRLPVVITGRRGRFRGAVRVLEAWSTSSKP